MATTTNFGWETPDDTDLVKDGALAIRTLGSAIDTSLVDLKGGTTGQVLSKTSNTDMDFTWVTSDDANAIQNAIVDAKGDLITATAADTPSRLAVGTDGFVLTADSTTATGLKWAAAASGSNTVGVSVYHSTTQTVANNTIVYPAFNSENFDTDGFHSTTTNNSRLTVPTGKAGYYFMFYNAPLEANSTGYRSVGFEINRAGTELGFTTFGNLSATVGPQYVSFGVAYLADGDYVEVSIYQNSGGNLTLYGGASRRFGLIRIGA